MPDDELGVGGLLARLEAPLREAHARLQLVVEDAAVAHHEEEVLLVALRRLALHVPVVFPRERIYYFDSVNSYFLDSVLRNTI